jgi:hypothetical protein
MMTEGKPMITEMSGYDLIVLYRQALREYELAEAEFVVAHAGEESELRRARFVIEHRDLGDGLAELTKEISARDARTRFWLDEARKKEREKESDAD